MDVSVTLLLVLAGTLLWLFLRCRWAPRTPTKVRMHIYFGSQTGTAERLASEMEGLAKKAGFATVLAELNSLTLDRLQAVPAVVVICSTQGKGDAPDNATKFLKALQTAAKHSEGQLAHLRFSLFGLGRIEYFDTFNKTAKDIQKALLALGAREATETVLGDDTLDLHGEFVKWAAGVLPAFEQIESTKNSGTVQQETRKFLPALVGVPLTMPDPTLNYERASEQYLSTRTLHTDPMRIVRSQLLKDDPFRPVYFMELDCGGVAYTTAQDAAIFPQNSKLVVRRLAEIQGYELDTVFSFQPGKLDVVPFPTPCTVEHALTNYCDLTGPVRKDLISALVSYAQDENDRTRLLELLQLPLDLFEKRITSAKLSVLDILQRYPSVKCPFPEFVQIVDRIIPRYFTIASSNLCEPDRLHLCVAILKETTSQMKQWTGLCTGFLESQCVSTLYTDMRVMVDDSKFRVPPKGRPLVMVANGCGVAPFRGLVRELQKRGDCGPAYLFFGCQSCNHGFLFKEEFEAALVPQTDALLKFEYRAGLQERGVLTRMFCAFSRDQPTKVYIQEAVCRKL